MEVPLAGLLLHHARLLEQIVGDDATHGIRLIVELDVHVLSEAAGVVVAVRLCVAEGFQNCIALDQNVLDSGKLIYLLLYMYLRTSYKIILL